MPSPQETGITPQTSPTFTRREAGILATAALGATAAETTFPLITKVVAKAQEAPPSEGINALLSSVLYSPERPGHFENQTQNSYDSQSIPGGIFTDISGDLKINFSMTANHEKTDIANPSTGFFITNQATGPAERRIHVTYDTPTNRPGGNEMKIGFWDASKNDWAFYRSLRPSDGTMQAGLTIAADGNSLTVDFADGASEKIGIGNMYNTGQKLELRTTVSKGATLDITDFAVEGTYKSQTTEIPPAQPESPKKVEFERFQFPDFSHPPEAKVGDIDVDGFELKGNLKGLFVTDMDYARTAIKKHLGESGKRLRIIMYDSISDVPKNIYSGNANLIRGFKREYYDLIEIADLLVFYGHLIEEPDGTLTIHSATDRDLTETTPAYSQKAGHHDVFYQEVVSRHLSSWVASLMRIHTKHLPPLPQRFTPEDLKDFPEDLVFWGKPIFVATQRITAPGK